jgi:transposase
VLSGHLEQRSEVPWVFIQTDALLAQKKRPEEEFAAKQELLTRLRASARGGDLRLFYYDEATFCASPPVQRSWSPLGHPHETEPAKHCTWSVLGALDFGAQSLETAVYPHTITRDVFIGFIDRLLQTTPSTPLTLIVLDNARIHHHLPEEVIDRWMIDHRTFLFYLPPYSPELNLIEIVWKKLKYHWRRFVTWSRESFDSELSKLLNGYGREFQISFS